MEYQSEARWTAQAVSIGGRMHVAIRRLPRPDVLAQDGSIVTPGDAMGDPPVCYITPGNAVTLAVDLINVAEQETRRVAAAQGQGVAESPLLTGESERG